MPDSTTHPSQSAGSRLLLDEDPLVVLPSLAKAIGINEAILLQQINYWLKVAERTHDERKLKHDRWWTYNSYPNWQQQMPWVSVAGLRKLVYKLEKLELIKTVQMNKHKNDQTKWYTINYAEVDRLVEGGVPESSSSGDTQGQGGCPKVAAQEVPESSSSLTETTTETTTERESARPSCREVSVALKKLSDLPGYSHNREENLKHLEKRYAKHKDSLDFIKEVENFCEYYEDRGFKKSEKPRSRLTTWLNNAADWTRPTQNGKNGTKEKREYDKYDAPDKEVAESAKALMEEIGLA